jgi:hypothetical protein
MIVFVKWMVCQRYFCGHAHAGVDKVPVMYRVWATVCVVRIDNVLERVECGGGIDVNGAEGMRALGVVSCDDHQRKGNGRGRGVHEVDAS